MLVYRFSGFNWISNRISSTVSTSTERILDRVPFPDKNNWAHLIDPVNQDTGTGIVEATWQMQQRYWRHWVDFLPSSFDPYLQNMDAEEQLVVLQAFARWAREGAFGRGKQVQTGSIQAAIGAIAKTIKLAGWPNPL